MDVFTQTKLTVTCQQILIDVSSSNPTVLWLEVLPGSQALCLCWINNMKNCLMFSSGWSFSMGSAYQFHSWRVFVVVCALPCVCAVVALTFMPESPRFYLEVRNV